MEPTQAIEVFKEVAANTSATLAVHQQIQVAIKTLEDVVAAQSVTQESSKSTK